MKIGIIFPQTEFGADPAAIRDFAQTADDLGFSHISAYDHVLGANPNRPGGWKGVYTFEDPFHEPMALFSFMAAVTERVSFLTSAIALPQRQTVLAAKQAATLDVLSGGRLRLGIGLGWNQVEFTALGENFQNRGRRIEEQVELMRSLWTQPLIEFSGQWHEVPDAGINPLPVQRPIPIWFGGRADAALRRIARLGNGWIPNLRTIENTLPHLEKLQKYLSEAGRSDEDFGIEASIHYREGDPERLSELLRNWSDNGATHIGLNTMHSRLRGPDDHMGAMRAFASAIFS